MLIQAYAGRVFNGKPVISDSVRLPENANLLITIADDFPFVKKATAETITQTNEEEIVKRMEMVESLIGCMAGYDIDLNQAREERLTAKVLLQ